ncbi:MAG: hypothetical protein H6742_10645 [Alphaproteobacteria bacterium]|nr:hypothetical protein [Alphaproteobacteria bacterium]
MLLPLLLACTSSSPDVAAPAVDVPEVTPVGFTLALSGNLDGEIEPCG